MIDPATDGFAVANMRDDAVVPFTRGTARILTLSGVRNLEAWKRAFQNKCKDHRYYELIEETLANNFEYRYAVLEDDSRNIRAIRRMFGYNKRR